MWIFCATGWERSIGSNGVMRPYLGNAEGRC
jgi:hypothetical protein